MKTKKQEKTIPITAHEATRYLQYASWRNTSAKIAIKNGDLLRYKKLRDQATRFGQIADLIAEQLYN